MWLDPETVTAPSGEPIALAAAKAYLRAGDDEDVTIGNIVADVRDHVEASTATRLVTQTVALRAGGFADLERLPIGPVQSVFSVEYIDGQGVTQTLDPSAYELFGAGLTRGIRPAFGGSWPLTRDVADAVTVTAIVGYGNAGAEPPKVRRAMYLLLGDYYMSREDTILERGVTPATLPNGVTVLLANHSIFL